MSPRNRINRKHTVADGAKAFDIANDMEPKLFELGRLFSVLMLMVEGTKHDPLVCDAVAHIGNCGDDLVKEIKDLQGQIYDLTWGYQYGPERKAPVPDVR